MDTKTNSSIFAAVRRAQVIVQWFCSLRRVHTRNRAGLVAVVLGVAFAPLCSRAGTLDLRTGAWEVTTTSTTKGMLIPKEILEQMPPERRALIEQRMRAREGQPSTRTRRSCVTQERLDRSELPKSGDRRCTRKVLSHSTRNLEIEVTCPPPHATKSHFKFEATSKESYIGSIDITQGEGGKVHIDMQGHWLAAVCKKGVDD